MLRIATLLLLFVACCSAAEPPAGTSGCWYTYGGLSAREFKRQSDSLSSDVQRQLNKYKNPSDPFWPKKASAQVDVSSYNVAVVNYVCCIYDRYSMYNAWIVVINGKNYLVVKGVSL